VTDACAQPSSGPDAAQRASRCSTCLVPRPRHAAGGGHWRGAAARAACRCSYDGAHAPGASRSSSRRWRPTGSWQPAQVGLRGRAVAAPLGRAGRGGGAAFELQRRRLVGPGQRAHQDSTGRATATLAMLARTRGLAFMRDVLGVEAMRDEPRPSSGAPARARARWGRRFAVPAMSAAWRACAAERVQASARRRRALKTGAAVRAHIEARLLDVHGPAQRAPGRPGLQRRARLRGSRRGNRFVPDEAGLAPLTAPGAQRLRSGAAERSARWTRPGVRGRCVISGLGSPRSPSQGFAPGASSGPSARPLDASRVRGPMPSFPAWARRAPRPQS